LLFKAISFCCKLASCAIWVFTCSHFSVLAAGETVSRNQFLADENARLSEQVKTQMAQLASLQQKLIALNSKIELQELTAEGLKKAVDEETRRRLLLEKELSFYRKVSKKKSVRFSISRISFKQTSDAAGYSYRFTIRKTKKDGVRQTGEVRLFVSGKRNGKTETVRIPPLEAEPMKYGFRIFQAFEGNASFGEGFSPQKLKIVMVDRESGKNVFQKTYSWSDVLAP